VKKMLFCLTFWAALATESRASAQKSRQQEPLPIPKILKQICARQTAQEKGAYYFDTKIPADKQEELQRFFDSYPYSQVSQSMDAGYYFQAICSLLPNAQ
jgi:hypothetical protein